MKVKKNIFLETYGKRKDITRITRVALFSILFLILTIVLTLARFSIIKKYETSPLTGFSNFNFIEKSDEKENNNQDFSDLNEDSSNMENSKKRIIPIEKLSSSPLIRDIPENSIISLSIGDEVYTLKKSLIIKEKPKNPDISLIFPAEYKNKISFDLCSFIRRAQEKGDMNIETHISKMKLFLKYKNMLKYRSCLGI